MDFNFPRYVAQRKREDGRSHGGGAAYAYPGDQKVMRALGRVTPVTLATEATVRLWKSVAKSQLLGTAVKVTDKQFPEIYEIVSACARRLHIPAPAVYISPNVGTLNAHTFGTEQDSYIVVNGILIDHLSTDELRFVVGHECGHIQNSHAVYMTALYYLMHSANMFVRWIVKPAVIALQAWARRAEITCDRAGLLCCGNLASAERALVKLALGSRKLAADLDIEEYLKQLEEARQQEKGWLSPGRVAESLQSHPYLPKRAAALRLFARTHYFLRAVGAVEDSEVGESLNWCDAQVLQLVSMFGRSEAQRGASAGESASASADRSQPRSGEQGGGTPSDGEPSAGEPDARQPETGEQSA